MEEDPTRLPPGHVERRQVSNEVLAFQMQMLQESSTSQFALLRDDVRGGFDRIQAVLDKHTDQIGGINSRLASIDTRTSMLEQFRADLESERAADATRVAAEARMAGIDQHQLRMARFLIAILVGVLSVGSAVLAIYNGIV